MNLCKTEQEYINAISLAAQRVCKRYGYLPSVLIAQSCLENGYAIEDYADNPSLKLLIKYNNGVGLKSELLSNSWNEYSVWEGDSLTKNTPEEYNGKKVTITDSFRKYDTMERSFADFLLFLTYASNYGKGGTPKYGKAVLSIKDPETLIKRVSALGYATDSQYSVSVMKIIRKHNLTKYDDLSGVEPTIYTPGYKSDSKEEEHMSNGNVKKLAAPRFIDNRAASKSQVPAWRNKSDKKYIVVHYLGVCGQNSELWDNGYGATFTIFWNGDVYYTADYTAVTWQCGGEIQGESRDGSGVAPHRFYRQCTNYNSVSIETCVKRTDGKYEGDDNDDKWYFTEESQESLVWAVSKMMDDLDIPIDRVIRHFDVTGKICPNPYVKNNKLHGNWTWEEFKANLAQYRKDGTITIPDRSGKKAEPTVEKWYRVRKSWSDESSQLGAYISLDNAKANCQTGYAVYDWNGKEVYMNKPETLTKTQTQFLNAVKSVCELARKEGWKYGDSKTSVPCLDKIISCDRMNAGFGYAIPAWGR